jgi:uncharacterized LabA/DUF88 family protein
MYFPKDKTEKFPRPVLGQLITAASPNKKGRIKALSTSWPAEICVPGFVDTLPEGKLVYAVARRENTLLIAPQDYVHVQSLQRDFAYTISSARFSQKNKKADMKERVAVFIDGANLFYAAAALKTQIDYRQLLHQVVAQRSVVGAFFYAGVNSSSRKERAFLSKILQEGYQVVKKELITRLDGSKKANLDVEIALDMVLKACEGRYDTAILVSGDGDFAYAVDTVRSKGLKVEVIGLRSMTSKTLIRSADRYTDLADIKASVCQKKRFQSSVHQNNSISSQHTHAQRAA